MKIVWKSDFNLILQSDATIERKCNFQQSGRARGAYRFALEHFKIH